MSKKILVVNGTSYANAIKGLGEIVFDGLDFIRNIRQYVLVMFTGGADISPELYGERSPNNLCMTHPARDKEEEMIFNMALDYEIPMTGICRGAQLINVLSGGKLIHHLDGHGMSDHGMTCLHDDSVIGVNSLHHQMIVPGKGGIVLGWASKKLSRDYFGNDDRRVVWDGAETEAIYIPDTRCFGVQYHPEIMHPSSEGYRYYYEGVRDLIELDTETFTRKYTNGGALYNSANGHE